MIQTTAQALITSMFKLTGILASEEVPSAVMLEDALLALNGWIDSLGTDRQTMLSIAHDTFALVVGQQTYTVGVGGDLDIDAPLTLDHVGLLLPDTTPPAEIQLQMLTDAEYAVQVIKTLTSSYPTVVYYQRPAPEFGTLWVWPVPQVVNQQLTVYWPEAITQFTALTEVVNLAPAYYQALRFNLATLIYPEYGIAPREDVIQTARNSLSALKRANFRMSELTVDSALVPRGIGTYNILTDTGA